MDYVKKHTKELTAGMISFIVGVALMWFSGGFARIQSAQAMEKYAEKVPQLEKKMEAFQEWIQGVRIKDSLQIIYWQKKILQDERQDEMILCLYKYLKIYTPEMEKIKIPQKID